MISFLLVMQVNACLILIDLDLLFYDAWAILYILLYTNLFSMRDVDPSCWTGGHSYFILFIYLFFLSPLFGPPFVVETFFVGEGGYNTFLFFIFLVVGYREWGSPYAVWEAERERERELWGGILLFYSGGCRRSWLEEERFVWGWGILIFLRSLGEKTKKKPAEEEPEGGRRDGWSLKKIEKEAIFTLEEDYSGKFSIDS